MKKKKKKMKIKLLHPDARPPMRMSKRAAGFDLFCLEDTMLIPGNVARVHTGIAIELPSMPDGSDEEYEAEVRGRSGLAFRHKIMCAHVGTIDADYRGEVVILLVNAGNAPYKLRAGERCGQLVLKKVWVPAETPVVDDLTDTERGEKGFGSTGN